ncbi:MAG: hypothetical protein ACRDV8_03060, partial [Acidimicrobiales bacterium]
MSSTDLGDALQQAVEELRPVWLDVFSSVVALTDEHRNVLRTGLVRRVTLADVQQVDNPATALRSAMVADLRASGVLVDPAVEAAMLVVPRHRFIPEVVLHAAYADEAVTVKRGTDGRALSSASQPTIVATMLQELGVRPGQRVLEVGTGTGYNAALLAHLAGEGGRVL